MKKTRTRVLAASILALAASAGSVAADEIPNFINETWPAHGAQAAWQSYKSVFADPEGTLDMRTKELIALAVAAQVPCGYCVHYHTRAAKAQGAKDAQIREALAAGALVRTWSTMLNGSGYSDSQWRREVDAMLGDD